MFDVTTHATLEDEFRGLKSVNYLSNARLNIADACFPAEYMSGTAGAAGGNVPAIVYANDDDPTLLLTYSHLQLSTLANQIALALQSHYAFTPGQTVGICMPMSPEAVAAYIGIIKAGGAVVSIADSFSEVEIATRMALANATIIFTQDVIRRGDKVLPLYTRVVAAGPVNIIVIPLDNHTCHPTVHLRPSDSSMYTILPPADSDAVLNYKSVIVPASHICNVLFSSGTTGEPKAIPWYHSNPIKAAIDGHIHQDVQPGDVVCWPTNLGRSVCYIHTYIYIYVCELYIYIYW